jgi:hypothetical protein
MAISGVKRVLDGFERSLSASEINRGYIFLCADRNLDEALDVKDFTIKFLGESLRHRRLDVSGRFHVSASRLQLLRPNAVLHIQVLSRKMLVVTDTGRLN